MGGSCVPGTLVLILIFLSADVTHCKDPTDTRDFITEYKSECHFLNGTERVRFLQRYLYNQEEFVYFDSDVGEFVPKTEFGRPSAEYWNKNKDLIEQKRAYVDTFCRHNYGILQSVTVDRRVEPSAKISVMKPNEGSETQEHLLVCNVIGFYPSEIEVKWFRNGQEQTTDVQSSELFQNGDWTFQIMVMLETLLRKGDKLLCEVHHNSLKSPLRVEWNPDFTEPGKNKRVTGIVGFVLGAVFIIAGLIIYLRSQKARATFRSPQSENFLQS